MSRPKHFMVLCVAALLTLGLAACGSDGGSDTAMPDPTPPPTPEPDPADMERQAIADAIVAAMTAVEAVNDASTDEEVMAADMAVDAAMRAIDGATHISAGDVAMYRTRLATISGNLDTAMASRTMTMTIDSERTAISEALMAATTAVGAVMDDSEDAVVTAAEEAIAAATAAINAAGHLLTSETMAEHAKVAALQTDLDAAKSSRQTAMDEAERMRQEQMQADARRTEQMNAITMAIAAARTAVGMVNDDSTQAQVDAANAAVSSARAKIAEGVDLTDDEKAPHTESVNTIEMSLDNAVASWNTAQAANQELANQRMDIRTAIAAARTAVNAVNDESSDEQVEAATQAIADARVAIAGASDVPAEEKAANSQTVGEIMAQLETAKESRTVAMEAKDKADDAAKAAMQATALKLHTGLEHGLGDTANARTAAYNTDEDAIEVTIGTATAVGLSEDKKTKVATLHGWEGKRYMASGTAVDGTYEAVVYSNVGEATMGDPFNEEYDLLETATATVLVGEVGVDTATAAVQARVASSLFDQSAGTKPFDLPASMTRVRIAGSYHGVSGNYYCTPTDADTKCSATVAADGFTLGGGTWAFRPTNKEAKVTETEDTDYASYGWWLHKAANGTYTASAFVDEKGTVADAASITDLRGTATYMGGAAGKYALHSSTGGTNDAGHFTARAMLEADFNADMISGTIDQFVGADGASRDWSVELKKTVVGDTGAITEAETVWTLGGTAADADGGWSGSLKDNGDDDVPKVATGTFHSIYSTAGRMVGAFGANKQ